MRTAIETWNEPAYDHRPTRRFDWNQWIEISLLWIAVLLVIGFWR